MENIEKIINEAYAIGMGQEKDEIFDFVQFIKNKNIKNVLEIGTERGGTFYLWNKIADAESKKISIDLIDSNFCFSEFSVKERNDFFNSKFNNVHFIEADSHEETTYLEVTKILNGEKVDLLFIDGDHSYEGVKRDFEKYQNIVSDNGYIVFHDIGGVDGNRHYSGYVSIFWDELECKKTEYRKQKEIFGIGVVKLSDYKEFILKRDIDDSFEPSITAVTLTYGRHKYLTEETIQSFLLQTYKNKKLLIINTHKDEILFENVYENIQVINETDRFDMPGQKLRFSLDFINTDFWCILEDDDICLPTHFEILMNGFKQAKSKNNNITASCNNCRLFFVKNELKALEKGALWWCYLFPKPDQSFKEYCSFYENDPSIDWKVVDYYAKSTYYIENQLPTYGYRWDTGSRHLSGWGPDKMKELMKICREEANNISNKDLWKPHWDNNYTELLNNFKAS